MHATSNGMKTTLRIAVAHPTFALCPALCLPFALPFALTFDL